MEDLTTTIGALVAGLLVALLSLLGLSWSRPSVRAGQPEEENPEKANRVVDVAARPTRTGERGGGLRQRWRTNRAGASSSAASSSGTVEERVPQRGAAADEDSDDDEDGADYAPRAPAKKGARRQQREANRQAEAAQRELKKEKEDRNAELRRQRDEAREAEERRKEEELAEQRRIEEEKAQAEYAQWKGAFALETEGTVEDDVAEQSQGLLQEFVDYIKKHKLVVLEDLAAEFELRTQDVVNRVIALEQMGRITGVMDERGKFVYISPEEMKAVAEYVKSVGRVSIAELARKSNEFIDLVPKTVPVSSTCADELFAEPPAMDVDATPTLVA
ncbi:hypothetical protein CBR_g8852 [Chara braunii]|uniref:DDRGK domain-containing protein 1 n=1 Tax=Chara braunii TaxID=69332 RepID=A0A388KNB4_CHABU|nr:hypothetical protein CBR_g8852 [Chara braunii]|eukprot:GBG71433.1 hypothetical protein CBR_g8852 [Chara braunii]